MVEIRENYIYRRRSLAGRRRLRGKQQRQKQQQQNRQQQQQHYGSDNVYWTCRDGRTLSRSSSTTTAVVTQHQPKPPPPILAAAAVATTPITSNRSTSEDNPHKNNNPPKPPQLLPSPSGGVPPLKKPQFSSMVCHSSAPSSISVFAAAVAPAEVSTLNGGNRAISPLLNEEVPPYDNDSASAKHSHGCEKSQHSAITPEYEHAHAAHNNGDQHIDDDDDDDSEDPRNEKKRCSCNEEKECYHPRDRFHQQQHLEQEKATTTQELRRQIVHLQETLQKREQAARQQQTRLQPWRHPHSDKIDAKDRRIRELEHELREVRGSAEVRELFLQEENRARVDELQEAHRKEIEKLEQGHMKALKEFQEKLEAVTSELRCVRIHHEVHSSAAAIAEVEKLRVTCKNQYEQFKSCQERLKKRNDNCRLFIDEVFHVSADGQHQWEGSANLDVALRIPSSQRSFTNDEAHVSADNDHFEGAAPQIKSSGQSMMSVDVHVASPANGQSEGYSTLKGAPITASSRLTFVDDVHVPDVRSEALNPAAARRRSFEELENDEEVENLKLLVPESCTTQWSLSTSTTIGPLRHQSSHRWAKRARCVDDWLVEEVCESKEEAVGQEERNERHHQPVVDLDDDNNNSREAAAAVSWDGDNINREAAVVVVSLVDDEDEVVFPGVSSSIRTSLTRPSNKRRRSPRFR